MTDADKKMESELEYIKDLPGYKRSHPHYFKDPVIDHLMEIVFLLAGEVWTNRDRQRIMENLLAKHGKVTPEMIENAQPDEELKAQLAAERKTYIRRVFGCLYGEEMLPGEGGFFDWFLNEQ